MYYATKHQWAAAKAAEIRTQIAAMDGERLPAAQWDRIRRREATKARLLSEECRFLALAARYERQGI